LLSPFRISSALQPAANPPPPQGLSPGPTPAPIKICHPPPPHPAQNQRQRRETSQPGAKPQVTGTPNPRAVSPTYSCQPCHHARIPKANVRQFLSLLLADLSPLTPPPEDHLLVVLKSYFDGSNHADSSEYDRISIAAVCGTSKQWKRFDTEWKKVLYRHRAGCPIRRRACGRVGSTLPKA
jgi:hypothetical protein